MSARVIIESLGARGDGIARDGGRTLFIPRALPGDEVLLAADGRIEAIIEPGPGRVEPPCKHYARCGGCAMQHAEAGLYREWKRGLVSEALRGAGIAAALPPLIDARGIGRRRLAAHIRREGKTVSAGFMQARSHALADLDHCLVLEPALARAFDIARALGETLAGLNKPLDAQITSTRGGLDVDLRGAGKLQDRERLALSDAAARLDLARLSNHGDLIVMRKEPWLAMGRARAIAPAGAFLQATEAGEQALGGFALEALQGAKHAADLFSGIGPFALRLAERMSVAAFDSEKASVEALGAAARGAQGLKPLTAEARDLFRRPLLPKELEAFDCIVLDPPRAGAESQARQLARASVPRAVSFSCDAASFARDAAILIAGGYRLAEIRLYDQFLYSAHVEIAALFERKGK